MRGSQKPPIDRKSRRQYNKLLLFGHLLELSETIFHMGLARFSQFLGAPVCVVSNFHADRFHRVLKQRPPTYAYRVELAKGTSFRFNLAIYQIRGGCVSSS